MTRLFLIIFTLAGPTLAGSAVVAALTMGMVDAKTILVAAALGAVAAVPVAWVVARQIAERA